MLVQHRIGEKIQQLREQQGLSVAELAGRSQCSTPLIEALECGELTPSLAPLLAIARGLGARLDSLLDDGPQEGAVCLRAADHHEVLRFSGIRHASDQGTLDFVSLAPGKKDRHMEPFLIDVHPAVEEDCTLSAHEGEEFLYVLQGSILVTSGNESFSLQVGDSIYYDSQAPHEVRAENDQDAKILAVVYTPC